MPPSMVSAACCISLPRLDTIFTPSASETTPAAASEVYSPSEKPAAESGAAVPGETPTGEKTPDNGDPAPAALSPQADEPQTDA